MNTPNFPRSKTPPPSWTQRTGAHGGGRPSDLPTSPHLVPRPLPIGVGGLEVHPIKIEPAPNDCQGVAKLILFPPRQRRAKRELLF